MKKVLNKILSNITIYLNIIPSMLLMVFPIILIIMCCVIINDKGSIGFILSIIFLSMLQIISLDINLRKVIRKIRELKGEKDD